MRGISLSIWPTPKKPQKPAERMNTNRISTKFQSLVRGYKHAKQRTKSATTPHMAHPKEATETCSMDEYQSDLYGISVARSWLQTCDTNHKFCDNSSLNASKLSDTISDLPRRLLDIGPPDLKTLKLIDTDNMDKDCRYIALSHCWGDAAKVVKTTDSNISEHYAGISWDDLSKTFQDAITVTQLLDFRYLWIDSLCIIQNNRADFEKECARMHIIYLNCHCMIAASDAHTGDEGLLRFWGPPFPSSEPRGSREMPAFCPKTAKVMRIDQGLRWRLWMDALSGPLSKRGWAYQERQLAPRILHYTTSGIMWECRACIGVGDSKALQPRRISHKLEFHKEDRFKGYRGVYIPLSRLFRLLDRHKSQNDNDIMAGWMHVVEDYSRRNLTFADDKLPALSGLAGTVASIMDQSCVKQAGNYLAGLWQADIHRQLCWFLKEPRPKDYVAKSDSRNALPSWSWASWNSPISFNIMECFGFVIDYDYEGLDSKLQGYSTTKYLATNIVPRGFDPFGQIQGSHLVVFGNFLDYDRLSFKYDDLSYLNDKYRPPRGIWWTRADPNLIEYRVIFDTGSPGPNDLGLRFLFLLHLPKNSMVPYSNRFEFGYGLVLQDTEEGVFKRLGIFFHNSKYESLIPEYCGAEEMTLV